MTSSENIVYRCRESIRWVKDSTQLVLIDEVNHKTFILQSAEAALWSWLSLGYSYKKLVTLLAVMMVQSPEEVEIWLRATLYSWYEQGILDNGDKNS